VQVPTAGAAPDDPTVSIEDTSKIEGDSGASSASLTVFLDHTTDHDVLVDYAAGDGTATSGDDYASSSGTARIPAGQATATIEIRVNADRTDEPDQTFTVTLSNPNGASIGDATAHGTITDDDSGRSNSLTISDASVTEGNTGTTNQAFRIRIEDPQTSPTTVDYATLARGGTVEAPDFVAKSGTARIPAGQSSRTVTVEVNGDKDVGVDENLQVRLSNAQGDGNPTITDATGVGTIVNDDTAVNLRASNAKGERVHVAITTNPAASNNDVVIYRKAAHELRTLSTGQLNSGGGFDRTLPNEFNHDATVRLFARITTKNGNYWSKDSIVTVN
jgi:Calx-beta domain